jgi:hypothetical protein
MVVSILHLKAKFRTPHGIGEVRGSLEDARRSYKDTRRRKETLPIDTLDAREEKRQPTNWGKIGKDPMSWPR